MFGYIETNHQSATAYILYLGYIIERVFQIFTYHHRVAHQLFLFYYFQYSQSSRASEMIAAKCGTQLEMLGLELRASDKTSYGKTIAHSLGHRIDIGAYTGEIMTE